MPFPPKIAPDGVYHVSLRSEKAVLLGPGATMMQHALAALEAALLDH